MEKKRIAFIISSLSPGGAERVVSNLANSLVDTYEVSILLLFKNEPFYKLDDRITIYNCSDAYEVNKTRIKSIFIQLQIIFKIYSYLKKHKINIAIGFMTTTNIYSIIASKMANIPCIVSERIHPEYSSLTKFWSKIRQFVYPLSARVIVQTEAIKTYYLSFLKDNQLQIIKNPLSDSLINSRNPEIKKERIILSVGRLSPQKNHQMLIEAFHEMNLKDWQLHIIGDGRKRQYYNEMISSYGLQKRIKLIGNVTNIADYYNTSSIFAFTSNFEGFPNALTEAMAFGMACISTDCPSGPSELIKNNENGYLIPVGDKAMLKEKLNSLVNNDSIRQKFETEAIKSTSIYSTKTITHEWDKLINTVLNN